MDSASAPYAIRCEHEETIFVYWKGDDWSMDMSRARRYDTRQEAYLALRHLTRPRGHGQGRFPVVFSLTGRLGQAFATEDLEREFLATGRIRE